MQPRGGELDDDFGGTDLDRAVWFPHYLPAWSSRARSAATYAVRGSCLVLTIPPAQGLWCAGDHEPALRVSGVQTASWSGAVGTTRGQQPYRDGLRVREAQEPFAGWTPGPGWVEVRARADVAGRSMVSAWLVGLEDEPERCAEICVFEIFSDAVEPGRSAAVGSGLHRFRDPAVTEDFAAPRLPVDVTEWHTYGARWDASVLETTVDGEAVRTCAAPPTYPLQLMLAVFDFPDRASADDRDHVPRLEIDRVRGRG
ncbi:glycoside hydrolase family 16 protein [Cellulomonas alba]|uniref:Glycoside hydrolase family 16 protein n=1 Tax=Cellulomonas alba TaxID=3053467 RepID=A0ABT7SBF1_9CELL|nr:glycoside hydrolase family 16 protein [Cellulomonas alba]MDM7853505.1 glycoside hydrolase family 16 protein [Cellulomonas alba]